MARKGKATAPVKDVEEQEASAASGESPEEAAIQEGRSWYVIHTYSGYENKVKTNLEHRIQTMDAKDLIFQVVVPTEDEIEIRDGQRRTVARKIFPGYVLTQMIELQDEVGELLPHVRAPLLVVHGRLDHTAPVDNADRLVQRVGSQRVERVILPQSFHQVGLDVERDAAAAALVRFAVAELGDPDPGPERREDQPS